MKTYPLASATMVLAASATERPFFLPPPFSAPGALPVFPAGVAGLRLAFFPPIAGPATFASAGGDSFRAGPVAAFAGRSPDGFFALEGSGGLDFFGLATGRWRGEAAFPEIRDLAAVFPLVLRATAEVLGSENARKCLSDQDLRFSPAARIPPVYVGSWFWSMRGVLGLELELESLAWTWSAGMKRSMFAIPHAKPRRQGAATADEGCTSVTTRKASHGNGRGRVE